MGSFRDEPVGETRRKKKKKKKKKMKMKRLNVKIVKDRVGEVLKEDAIYATGSLIIRIVWHRCAKVSRATPC